MIKTHKSIRDRILKAATVLEVDTLFADALTFKYINPRTLRKVEAAVERRKQELGGAK